MQNFDRNSKFFDVGGKQINRENADIQFDIKRHFSISIT